MDYSLEATHHRTALLLGLIEGEVVHRWAEAIIEHQPDPPQAVFEVVSASPTDLSALRYALWPLVVEPDPPVVLQAILGLVHADLASGRRELTDTLTVLRQMRSMLRLPPLMYADLNSALVAHAAKRAHGGSIAGWLQQFAHGGLAQLRPT